MIPVEPVQDPLETPPVLSVRLHTEPEIAQLGDIVTITVQVESLSTNSANAVRLEVPLPAGTVALDQTAFDSSKSLWQWSFGDLQIDEMQTVTATMRLTSRPSSEAVLVIATATAHDQVAPVTVTGGALIGAGGRNAVRPEAVLPHDLAIPPLNNDLSLPLESPAINDQWPGADVELPNSRDLGLPSITGTLPISDSLLPTTPETLPISDSLLPGITGTLPSGLPLPLAPGVEQQVSDFVPGSSIHLSSPDQRVTVEVPSNLSPEPLTLVYADPHAARAYLRDLGQPIPHDYPGGNRSFGAFFLHAFDAKGNDIHQFAAPVTIRVRVTPEQLLVLNRSFHELQFFWFDPDFVQTFPNGNHQQGMWLPIETKYDEATMTISTEVDHFSSFALGNGLSPSMNFLPTLKEWQVDGFTGGLRFNYPIEVPAGPGGIQPSLSLSYASDATDGPSGAQRYAQSSWVGRGWSFDPGGSISRVKNYNGPRNSDSD